jgi:hypothetical protein
MRLVLAKLIWRFDLAAVPGCNVDWTKLKTYVLVQKEPIRVIVKDRLGLVEM